MDGVIFNKNICLTVLFVSFHRTYHGESLVIKVENRVVTITFPVISWSIIDKTLLQCFHCPPPWWLFPPFNPLSSFETISGFVHGATSSSGQRRF